MATSTTGRVAPATKTSSARTTTPAPARPAALAEAALPKVVRAGETGAATSSLKQADLKKKDLIDQVVARSGIKKKDAKPVIEAMLAILGETLGSGRDLNLPPMGKLRINRTHERPGFRIIISKLRQSTGGRNQPAAPLAEPAE